MRRARIAALSLLALAVPTFAFGGEQPLPGPAALSVSASLGGCGVADAAMVCQIDASWSGVEGADYYAVSVTRADGSVVDLGQGSGTSRSIFVPYVGPGTYSVEVVAWGTPPGEDDAEVLARSKTLSTASQSESGGASATPDATPPGEGRESAEPAAATDEPSADPAPAPAACEGEEPDAEAEEPTAAPALEDGAGQDSAIAAAEPTAQTAPAPEGDAPAAACP
jgi:hypothetical protein